MKSEKEIKARFEEELDEINLRDFEDDKAIFFGTIAWMNALRWVLKKEN